MIFYTLYEQKQHTRHKYKAKKTPEMEDIKEMYYTSMVEVKNIGKGN